ATTGMFSGGVPGTPSPVWSTMQTDPAWSGTTAREGSPTSSIRAARSTWTGRVPRPEGWTSTTPHPAEPEPHNSRPPPNTGGGLLFCAQGYTLSWTPAVFTGEQG